MELLATMINKYIIYPEKLLYLVPGDLHMYMNTQAQLSGYMICAIFLL